MTGWASSEEGTAEFIHYEIFSCYLPEWELIAVSFC